MLKKINLAAFVSALLLALPLMLSGCGASGPKSSIQQFYYHMSEGDHEGALEYVSKDLIGMMGQQKLEMALEEGARKIKAKGGVRSLEFTKEEIHESYAEVTVVVTYGNGEKEEDSTRLVQEDGRWKIGMSK